MKKKNKAAGKLPRLPQVGLKFSVEITSPYGICKVESDNWESINYVLGKERLPGNLDAEAERVWLYFRQARSKKRMIHTGIEKRGLELPVIKCYLSGYNIKKTSSFLLKKYKYKASKSALGRYWVNIRRLGISPLVFPKKTI
ncbi:MAG: hypothetical protein ABIG61_07530 [Planctomycetota bacterium]